jgi:hypothetical protein
MELLAQTLQSVQVAPSRKVFVRMAPEVLAPQRFAFTRYAIVRSAFVSLALRKSALIA